MDLIDARIVNVVTNLTAGFVIFCSVMMVILSVFLSISSIDSPLRKAMRSYYRMSKSPLLFAFSFYEKTLGGLIFILTVFNIIMEVQVAAVVYLLYIVINLVLYSRIVRQ